MRLYTLKMKILLQKLFHPNCGSSTAASVAVEFESDVRAALGIINTIRGLLTTKG